VSDRLHELYQQLEGADEADHREIMSQIFSELLADEPVHRCRSCRNWNCWHGPGGCDDPRCLCEYSKGSPGSTGLEQKEKE
jgi:hypothetical protein